MGITSAQHDHYRTSKSDWRLVQRMLTGEGAKSELQQRFFEHDEHYTQRKRDADFTPLTRYLLGRLVGMLFQRADDVDRDLGPLSEDALETAGPQGEDYSVVLMQLGETLLAYNEAVVTLNPARGLEVAPPLVSPVWTDQEAVVVGRRLMGDTVMDDIRAVHTWTRYTPDGYEVYRKGDDGEDHDVLIEDGRWAENEDGAADAFFVDGSGQPMAPVLRIEMPWEAKLGLLLARKHRAIFEMESRRDFALSSAMNGLIQIGVGGDTDLSDAIEDKTKKGAKMIPYDKDMGEHKGLQMPTKGVELGMAVLDGKRETLYEVAYNALEEAARQSATEAMIKHQGGAGAALSVFAETMADAESRILHLWNQAADFRLAGPSPTSIDASVTWPTDYSDIAGEEDLVDRLFPGSLPADLETATQVVLDFLRGKGYDPDEASIQERVQQQLDRSTQAADAGAGGFFG